MEFFEHQDRAKRQTAMLVGLFALSVVGVILALYAFAFLALWFLAAQQSGTDTDPDSRRSDPPMMVAWSQFSQPGTLLSVGGAAVLLIGGGSTYKLAQLRGGGRVVAESLGGSRVDPQRADPEQRKLLNVVEEMALASGLPVPPVYVMEGESGINAFAAGNTPDDAVIGVTRGALHQLSRDELQGVMAHEFSHILHGDMRLNLRMMGLVYGILVIALVGLMLLRNLHFAGVGGNSRGRGKAMLLILAAGVSLLVIGMVGKLFAEMIKAATSRQREYLADAAAVQYTRNPEGLSGALKKIGGLSRGARVSAKGAEEASHAFFGQAVTAVFATHPPLSDRIRRIEPNWRGAFPQVEEPEAETASEQAASGVSSLAGSGSSAAGAATASGFAQATGSRAQPVRPADTDRSVGEISPQRIEAARSLLAGLPEALLDAAHEPYAARGLIYALMLDPADDAIRDKQWARLRDHAESGLARETERLHSDVATLPREDKLPMLELALPALHELTAQQEEQFLQNLDALAAADGKLSLFEWSLRQMTRHALRGGEKPGDRDRHSTVKTSAKLALSCLARIGHDNEVEAEQAFRDGARELLMGHFDMLPANQCSLQALGPALDRLAHARMGTKRRLLRAFATCATADDQVTRHERELLRVFGAYLGLAVPLPDGPG